MPPDAPDTSDAPGDPNALRSARYAFSQGWKDVVGGPQVNRIGKYRAGADHDHVGNRTQESHQQAVHSFEAADFSAALATLGQRRYAVEGAYKGAGT